MTRSPHAHEIQIEVDGRLVAAAKVSRTDDPDVVRSAMHVESGHLPSGSRTKLVDAVLEDPHVSAASHLAASVPAGDTEFSTASGSAPGPSTSVRRARRLWWTQI